MKDGFETYCCEYEHEGSTWSVEIPATSFEDAAQRLRKIGEYGKVLGTLQMVIPVVPGIGEWFPNLVCKVASVFRR